MRGGVFKQLLSLHAALSPEELCLVFGRDRVSATHCCLRHDEVVRRTMSFRAAGLFSETIERPPKALIEAVREERAKWTCAVL